MKSEQYQVSVNEKFIFELDTLQSLDAVQLADGTYHILQQGKVYQAEVMSIDFHAKQLLLRVNGKPQMVKVSDSFDQLVHKMGLSVNVVHKVSNVKAPMPGLVLNVLVEPGQSVHQGEPLIILEAMKMENVIKSPGDGVVKRIAVEKGRPVDKGQVLIEMA